jgi:hypothetical protein
MDIVETLTYKKRGTDDYYPPLKYYQPDEKTLVGIYQGFRGENPELDFIVKYKEEGGRLRTPSHTHWIVDLLVKCETQKDMVRDYINDMINMYDSITPFGTKEERDNYQLRYVNDSLRGLYGSLSNSGYYSIETLTTFIELFSKCEKQTSGAFMFKNLLELVKKYTNGEKDFYQVIGYSKRV